MSNASNEAPCQTCDAPVRIRRERGEMSVADTSPPVILRRVCTNRDCPTNGRDKSLADVV